MAAAPGIGGSPCQMTEFRARLYDGLTISILSAPMYRLCIRCMTDLRPPGKIGAASGQAKWFSCLIVPKHGDAFGAPEDWSVGLR
jgi:hypothetical protein